MSDVSGAVEPTELVIALTCDGEDEEAFLAWFIGSSGSEVSTRGDELVADPGLDGIEG